MNIETGHEENKYENLPPIIGDFSGGNPEKLESLIASVTPEQQNELKERYKNDQDFKEKVQGNITSCLMRDWYALAEEYAGIFGVSQEDWARLSQTKPDARLVG